MNELKYPASMTASWVISGIVLAAIILAIGEPEDARRAIYNIPSMLLTNWLGWKWCREAMEKEQAE